MARELLGQERLCFCHATRDESRELCHLKDIIVSIILDQTQQGDGRALDCRILDHVKIFDSVIESLQFDSGAVVHAHACLLPIQNEFLTGFLIKKEAVFLDGHLYDLTFAILF